jgi:hypothetical protein
MLFSASTAAQTQPASRLSVGVSAGSAIAHADAVTGSQPAVGGVLFVRVSPLLTLEAEVLRPTGALRRQYTGESISFATDPNLSPDELRRTFVISEFTTERRTDVVVSGGIAIHPRQSARIQPRLFVGVTNHSVAERRTLRHLHLPPGVTLEQVNRAMAPDERSRRQLGGLTVGASVAVRVSPRLAIVPDLRFDYGSIGDEINNWLRPSLRVMWTF